MLYYTSFRKFNSLKAEGNFSPYFNMADQPYVWYPSRMALARFEWDHDKDLENQRKHRVSFSEAQYAFADSNRVIAEDLGRSAKEKRHYCFGRVDGGVLTVRFTHGDGIIRIFGAGYWRKGKSIYDRENQIHE